MLRVSEITQSVKSRFDSVAEIGKAVKRRGETKPVEQKSWKARGVIGIGRGQKPSLDIALHANGNTK